MDHRYGSATEDDAKSTALRLLIHYLGDIHQPLHCTSKVDHEYPGPDGDRGGNSIPIAEKNGIDELHAVWDSILYKYDSSYTLPFDESSWD